jgi:hypothetical protein
MVSPCSIITFQRNPFSTNVIFTPEIPWYSEPMKHFYENIPGWFDFSAVYKRAVFMAPNLPNQSHFIEIGSFLGRSCAYMAVEILNSGKAIKFDVVDRFVAEEPLVANLENKKLHQSFKDDFLRNIEPVIEHVNVLEMLSTEAAQMYRDESLDFVFIDANHNYDFVRADISAWLPKLRKDGIIAGHDYNSSIWPDVTKAVHEAFGGIVEKLGMSWIVNMSKLSK